MQCRWRIKESPIDLVCPHRSIKVSVSRPIRIAILLERECRSRDGAARVQAIAATLGIDVTAASEVFVTGTLSFQLYDLLFGVDAAGRQSIAGPLSELVESVAVLPG